MKVIVNNCFGGYSLSPAAIALGVERGSEAVEPFEADPNDSWTDRFPMVNGITYWESDIRQCPIMVAIVEELGEAANGPCARLKVVEVPDNVKWHIEDYDGIEAVHEDHRVWS